MSFREYFEKLFKFTLTVHGDHSCESITSKKFGKRASPPLVLGCLFQVALLLR
jgi:hypothetical protein